MIVLYQSEWAILLLDKKNKCCHKWLRRTNITSFEIFWKRGIKLCLFHEWERVHLKWLWFQARNKFYSMVLLTMFWENIKFFLYKYRFKTLDIVRKWKWAFIHYSTFLEGLKESLESSGCSLDVSRWFL